MKLDMDIVDMSKKIQVKRDEKKKFWFASEKAKHKIVRGVHGVQTTAKRVDSSQFKHFSC